MSRHRISAPRQVGAAGASPGSPSRYRPAKTARAQASERSAGYRPQAKLAISQPGDAAEREADRIAEQVMRSPSGLSTCPQCAGSPGCATCSDEARLQRKATPRASAEATLLRDTPLRELGAGEPLARATRSDFEARFAHDFGAVRIHADHAAADAARSIDARAYTLGRDIVFGAGEFAPGTDAGRRLLAHELTHVVQQGAAPQHQPASAADRASDAD